MQQFTPDAAPRVTVRCSRHGSFQRLLHFVRKPQYLAGGSEVPSRKNMRSVSCRRLSSCWIQPGGHSRKTSSSGGRRLLLTRSSQLITFSCTQVKQQFVLQSKLSSQLEWLQHPFSPHITLSAPSAPLLLLSPSPMAWSSHLGVRFCLLLFWMNVHGSGEKLQFHPASLNHWATGGSSVLSS